MPRDDLSIDFIKRMPLGEALDPATILDDWVNRAANLHEEVRYLQNEVADKDQEYNECLKIIDDRDGKIQKWIKANGSHAPNPKEEAYRVTIRENYIKAEKLANEKIALTQRLKNIYDRPLKQLDVQIKTLYDRNEPGFDNPDEVPSLIRPSAANHSAPSARSLIPSSSSVSTPLNPILNSAIPSAVRAANPQLRVQTSTAHAASAPATPAASMILNRPGREGSAGPTGGAPKRGVRANSNLGNLPTTSSNLARHTSIGPGTPAVSSPGAGSQRAGSAGPRSVKAANAGPTRKAGTPSSVAGRKKANPAAGGANKSNLSRVKRPSKNSPSSTAESELSEAESASDSPVSSRRGTPARSTVGDGKAAHRAHHPHPKTRHEHDDDAMDLDDDEAGDDKKYCTCQNVSFGDMVACDNDECPYEWFHWSCVGLKSEPNGTWYCPVCSEKMNIGKKGK